ncbi:MAG TPA: hypoxanthine-guanine phosphoribosyltransferase [Cycloclasticus sp.]|jgi:hypoxanthine phosphoribosyltransferase|nr:hypoxanthine-guanine phosphoribosyltransferase [Cycloclasticus sp.]HIL93948.1 hypoxanthine-guanine phosphoribosyltransferase [Cycloclasticus sp.]
MDVSLAEIEIVENNSVCLLDEREVESMFTRLAEDITEKCSDMNPIVLCVMTGAVVAVGRLLPKLKFPLEMDYIHATRYQGKTVGEALVWKQLPTTTLLNRTVIIVDDVLDEGITMAKLKEYCVEQGAERCYTAVLVDKAMTENKPVTADFVGFQAGNDYLFGLGMDYKGYLRNVSGLYACPENLEELLCQC